VKTKVIKLKGGPLGQREGKRKRKGSHKKEWQRGEYDQVHWMPAWQCHNETQYFVQLIYANKYGETHNHLNSNIKPYDKFRIKNG
jgi:hypothetical protein